MNNQNNICRDGTGWVSTHSQLKRIWFWYITAPAADASKLRIRNQSKNSEYSQQSGPILHIVWTD